MTKLHIGNGCIHMIEVRKTELDIEHLSLSSHLVSFPSYLHASPIIMSSSNKKLTASRIDDLVLGAFALAPTSETLDHAIRYLSTWSGSEYVERAL